MQHDDEQVIYRKSFRHYKSGKIIVHPEGGVFRFVIKPKNPRNN